MNIIHIFISITANTMSSFSGVKFFTVQFRPVFTSCIAIPDDWDSKKVEWSCGKYFYKGKEVKVKEFQSAQDQYDDWNIIDEFPNETTICEDVDELEDAGIIYDFEPDDDVNLTDDWLEEYLAKIPVD
jgi:hypothetical protein